MKHRTQDLLKAAATGLIGGLVGTWAMTKVQSLVARIAPATPDSLPKNTTDQDPATVKAADALTHRIAHRGLRAAEKDRAGQLVHYGFGAANGVLYGLLAARIRNERLAFGLPFGLGLWAAADEIGAPALGLAKWWPHYPISAHARALAAHLVYGATTDAVRRAGLRALA